MTKPLLILAMKDIRLLLRDRMGLFFVVAFPILMGIAFGLVGAGFAGDGHDRKEAVVLVVDGDDSPMSRRFLEHLDEADDVAVKDASDVESARRQVLAGKALAVLRIPKGFGETAGVFWSEKPPLGLGVDPSRKAEGAMLQGRLMEAAGRLMQDRFRDPASLRPIVKKTRRQLAENGDIPEATRSALDVLFRAIDDLAVTTTEEGGDEDTAGRGGSGPSMEILRLESIDVRRARKPGVETKLRSRWDISFPAAILWGILSCMGSFAVSIVKEKQSGTLFRLRAAPIGSEQILLGKGLACMLTALGVIALMMGLGAALGIQLQSPGLLLLAALCTAFGFSGLMMLMSVLGKTEQAVAGAGWALIVTMAMFGGGMIPLAFMPSFMVKISNFSPVKWGILSFEGAIWRGFTLGDMLLPCVVLVGMGLVGYLLGFTRLRRSF